MGRVFLAPRVEEESMTRTTENRGDRIEQTGSHPDKPMLRALAEFRDLERWQGRIDRV